MRYYFTLPSGWVVSEPASTEAIQAAGLIAHRSDIISSIKIISNYSKAPDKSWTKEMGL